jgi:hypothetical protein
MSAIRPSAARRQLVTPARFAAVFAVLTLAGTVVTVWLLLHPPNPDTTVQLCGHSYQVAPGQVLDVSGFGPHCTAIVTGGR